MTLTTEKQVIPVDRLTFRSSISFDTADSRLRSSIQSPNSQTLPQFLAQGDAPRAPNRESYEAWVHAHVGPHGFMYFHDFQHGRWLPFYGAPTSSVVDAGGNKKDLKATRFVLGNPLIAITMLRHDLDAGLCVPVELYLAEEVDGGVRIVWFKPASLIAGYEGAKEELVDAAEALSAKLEAFIRWVLRDEGEQKL